MHHNYTTNCTNHMASIQKRGDKWRVFVHVDNKRSSRTFATKREATQWANEQERHGVTEGHTLADAIIRYRQIAESHKGAQSELSRLSQLERSFLGPIKLADMTAAKIAKYRDERLQSVGNSSVRRELIILSAMLKVAKDEWGWIHSLPTETVAKPISKPPRRRGVLQTEIDAIDAELRLRRTGKQIADMFLLSIESGMRLSEILSLTWANVAEKSVRLPETKNGDKRQVPLSVKAREIIAGRRGIDPDRVFTVSPIVASQRFKRARNRIGLHDVHFHDARSEAITRLSKKLDVMELARVIGHRDLKSLMIYYAKSADDIADKL